MLAIHGALGLLLIVAAVTVLTRAILARQRVAIAAAAAGLAPPAPGVRRRNQARRAPILGGDHSVT